MNSTEEVKSGYLQKRGELNRAWRQRWCSLQGNVLVYCKEKGGKPLDSIKLDQAVVRQQIDEDGTPFCFEIVTKNRAYMLAATSRSSMHDWIQALASKTTLHNENLQIELAELQIQDSMRRAYFKTDPNNNNNSLSPTNATANGTPTKSQQKPAKQPTAASSASSSSSSSSSSSTAAASSTASTTSSVSAQQANWETKKVWALEALSAGNFQHGRDLLIEVLAERPTDANVLFQLGCAESLLRRRHEACLYIEQALANGFVNIDAVLTDVRLTNVKEYMPAIVKPYRNAMHILNLMKNATNGVDVRERTWMLRTYPNCFVGKDAVDWLLRNRLCESREEAVAVGRELVRAGFIRHVLDEHDFEDQTLYYRFTDSSQPPSSSTTNATSSSSTNGNNAKNERQSNNKLTNSDQLSNVVDDDDEIKLKMIN